MNKNEIIELINYLNKENYRKKGDDFELVRSLSSVVKYANDEEKSKIIKLFINEIKNNSNGHRDLCLETIVYLKLTKIAPKLEKIFINQQIKDDWWEYKLTTALLKLGYNSNASIKYIRSLINNKPESGNGYFLLIYLSPVKPEISLTLLSEYYAKNLANSIKIQKFVASRLDFLFEYISKNGSNYVVNLVKRTYDKNSSTANLVESHIFGHVFNKRFFQFNIRFW